MMWSISRRSLSRSETSEFTRKEFFSKDEHLSKNFTLFYSSSSLGCSPSSFGCSSIGGALVTFSYFFRVLFQKAIWKLASMPSASFDIWKPVSNFFRTSPSLLKWSSPTRTCFCSLLDVHPIYELSSQEDSNKTEENVLKLRGVGEKETSE